VNFMVRPAPRLLRIKTIRLYPKGAPVWRTQKFTALDSKNSNAALRDGLAVGGSSEKLDITRFVVTSMRLMNEYKESKIQRTRNPTNKNGDPEL
jgi:hypothetical protein